MIDGLGTPRRLLVLGGASEIGLAIAEELVATRPADVVLAGRSSPRLTAAADHLRSRGHTVTTMPFDASQPESHDRALSPVFADGDVDVVIVAFGVLGDQEAITDDPTGAAGLATVNFTGAVSAGLVVARHLHRQGHGAIIALSSMAAERARRANFVYGSSKAGFDAFFNGLGDHLHGSGVHVTVVRPGFVHSRMTAGRADAPFATTPAAVASATGRALRRRQPVVWVPPVLRLVGVVSRLVPRAAWRRIRL